MKPSLPRSAVPIALRTPVLSAPEHTRVPVPEPTLAPALGGSAFSIAAPLPPLPPAQEFRAPSAPESAEIAPESTVARSAAKLKTVARSVDNISYEDFVSFVEYQISEEAGYIRRSLDFSDGQILHDPKDRKIGSNTVSQGVVCMKPHGSSYLSRISKNNFTDQGSSGYIAVDDHVMTLLENSLYDGLAKSGDVGSYSKFIHQMAQDAEVHSQLIAKDKKYQPDSRYKITPPNQAVKNPKSSTVFAVETALDKIDLENFTVKSFIQNGRFGHQNNCAVITNFLLVFKSAFGDEEAVDEAIFSLIKKTSKVKEVEVKEARSDGILIKESAPRLEVRSVRAFFATFLSMKGLYEERGVKIEKDQGLYTKTVEGIVDHFQPLPHGIKDDVNDRLFWNVYQKAQLAAVLGVSREERQSGGR